MKELIKNLKMVKLKQVKVGLLLMAFSITFSIAGQGQNVANKFMGDFLNEYYLSHDTSILGTIGGYDLRCYDSIFIVNEIINIDTCRSTERYILDNELFNIVDTSIYFKNKFILNKSKISLSKPNIIIRDLKCLHIGYAFTIEIVINKTSYITQFYYSKLQKKLIKIERTLFVLP